MWYGISPCGSGVLKPSEDGQHVPAQFLRLRLVSELLKSDKVTEFLILISLFLHTPTLASPRLAHFGKLPCPRKQQLFLQPGRRVLHEYSPCKPSSSLYCELDIPVGPTASQFSQLILQHHSSPFCPNPASNLSE